MLYINYTALAIDPFLEHAEGLITVLGDYRLNVGVGGSGACARGGAGRVLPARGADVLPRRSRARASIAGAGRACNRQYQEF